MQRTDELLAQILNGIEANNVASNNMQSYLKEIARSSSRQGGSGGNNGDGGGRPPGGNGDRDAGRRGRNEENKGIFDSMSKTLQSFGGTRRNSQLHQGLSNESFVKLAGNATKASVALLGITPVTKMFAALVTSGMALYEFMNESYKMYTDLNSAGVTMSDSMFSIKASASQAWISMDEFGSVMKSNTSVLTAMQAEGGNAVDRFASLSNTVLNLQSTMGEYGLQNKQIVGLTAQYIKYQKLSRLTEQMDDNKRAVQTNSFISTMIQSSKVLGKSIDEITKAMQKHVDSSTYALEYELSARYGLTDDIAKKTTENMNMQFAALGDAGTQFQKQLEKYIATGIVPEGSSPEFIDLLDKMRDQVTSGAMSTSEGAQEVMKGFQGMIDDIDIGQLSFIAQQVGGEFQSMVNNMVNMKQTMAQANYAFNEQKPLEGWDLLASRFNNWLSGYTSAITQWWNTSIDAIGKWLTRDLAEGEGFWSNAWDRFVGWVADDIPDWLRNSIALPLRNFFANFDTILIDALNEIGTYLKEAISAGLEKIKKYANPMNWFGDDKEEAPKQPSKWSLGYLFGDDVDVVAPKAGEPTTPVTPKNKSGSPITPNTEPPQANAKRSDYNPSGGEKVQTGEAKSDPAEEQSKREQKTYQEAQTKLLKDILDALRQANQSDGDIISALNKVVGNTEPVTNV